MYDVDIRFELRMAIAAEHAVDDGTVVVEELGLRQGHSRVDVAVVNGAIKGYEIKSPADSLRRLPAQAACYGQVLDYVEIVLADAHREDALAIVPSWWGVMLARRERGRVCVEQVRPGQRNPGVDGRALAELLWHADAIELLRSRGAHRGLASKPRAEAWNRVADLFTVAEIGHTVRERLRARAGQRPAR